MIGPEYNPSAVHPDRAFAEGLVGGLASQQVGAVEVLGQWMIRDSRAGDAWLAQGARA